MATKAQTETKTNNNVDVNKLFKELTTKSAVIRKMAADGMKTAAIHKALVEAGVKSKNGTAIRYQHVRNVLNQPLKKNDSND